ncbi:MAG: 50S ribosomal protein L10 [Phycisphaerae bacterium]
MSKPVKELIRKELSRRLTGVTSMAVVGFTGLDAIATRTIRGLLREKGVRMTIVKNSIARSAFKSLGLAGAEKMLDGPCALAYGGEGVVEVIRTLLGIGKDFPKLTVKAAMLDGEVFSSERVDALSKYPTRMEAIGRIVSSLLSPGATLAGCLIGPSAKIASILKSIEEKKKEEKPAAVPEAPAAAAPAAETKAAAPAAAPAAPAAPSAPAAPEAPKAG